MNYTLSIITETDVADVVAFLAQNEETSIALMSHFCKNNKPKLPESYIAPFVITENETSTIKAVFTISKSGVILHHFECGIIDNHKDELKKLVRPVFLHKKIYSIIGEKTGTQFINDLISDFCFVRQQIDYNLMLFSDEFMQKSLNELPKNITLHACNQNDVEQLFCMQAKYELEEVLPPYEKFNSDTCRLNLRHNLGNQHIFALIDTATNKYVAKAGTNTIGLNWVQIGGVFTEEAYRKRGFATFLVHQLAKSMKTNNKKVALFVRVVNESAKHAYTKAGFIQNRPFSIYYY